MPNYLLTFISCYLSVGVIIAAISARSVYREEIGRRSLYLAAPQIPTYKQWLFFLILATVLIFAWPFYLLDKYKKRKRLSTSAVPIASSDEETPLLHINSYVGSLVKKYDSMAEAEAEYGFSSESHEWQKLLSKRQVGDELWSYSTSDDSWANGAGRAGVRLIRGDKVVANIMTSMN